MPDAKDLFNPKPQDQPVDDSVYQAANAAAQTEADRIATEGTKRLDELTLQVQSGASAVMSLIGVLEQFMPIVAGLAAPQASEALSAAQSGLAEVKSRLASVLAACTK